MTALYKGGRVLRFPKAPLKAVIRAERVKSRRRFGTGSGLWRLKLECGHTMMPLKLVADIAEAEPPARAACWKCLGCAAGRPVS